jgi:hypothetical protein
MVDLKLHERSKEELYRLREQVKISNLTYNEKTMLIRDIEMHMSDVELAKHRHILVQIQEGMAEISDICN